MKNIALLVALLLLFPVAAMAGVGSIAKGSGAIYFKAKQRRDGLLHL